MLAQMQTWKPARGKDLYWPFMLRFRLDRIIKNRLDLIQCNKKGQVLATWRDGPQPQSYKLNSDQQLSTCKAAGAYCIPHSTLGDHMRGLQTCAQVHVGQQNLSPAEEEVLVKWAKVLGHWGLPFVEVARGSCLQQQPLMHREVPKVPVTLVLTLVSSLTYSKLHGS